MAQLDSPLYAFACVFPSSFMVLKYDSRKEDNFHLSLKVPTASQIVLASFSPKPCSLLVSNILSLSNSSNEGVLWFQNIASK